MVALLGAACKERANMKMCIDYESCDECKNLMELGIFLISVSNYDRDFRTDRWCEVKDEAIERWFDKESVDGILKMRIAFVADDAWDKMSINLSSLQSFIEDD